MQVKFSTNPIRLLLVIALACAAAHAQVSLSTVVELAQRNSRTVKLAEADLAKEEAGLSQAKEVFIPSVELGAGLPAFPAIGFTGGVPSILNGNVQSLVFSLPQFQYVKAARASFTAAALNLNNAREEVALEASTTYIELDTVHRELEAAAQQQAFAERLAKIEQDRAEAGVDPLSDLLQVLLTAAQLKLRHLHLETRAGTLAEQLATLTGMPVGTIAPDHASIPEIPQVRAGESQQPSLGIQSALLFAVAKEKTAKGDRINEYSPRMSFNALYSRSPKLLNDFDNYYRQSIPTNNFDSGFDIQVPLFDRGRGAQARQSAADALRAKVEAEQAQQQSDIQIASLTGSLRELDTLAEIAGLKQQIADEQLKTVLTQLESGNGCPSGPGGTPQLTPKAEQLARIEERQKYQDALDADLDLAKARLNLLRALGHMGDWLRELHQK